MSEVVQRNTVDLVQSQKAGLAAALADRIGVDRFTRAAITAFRTTPALQRCTPESILGSLFVAAQLGLEVGGPLQYAHLVPYGRDAQLVVGYRGFLELFYRAGARSVRADIIREGDHVMKWVDDSGRVRISWTDEDPLDTSRKPVAALATVVQASGEATQFLMTKAEILARKPRTSRSGPWSDWEEEMWKKTVLRQAAKTTRMSSDLALAVEADQSITTGTGDDATRRHPPVGEVEEPIDLTMLTTDDNPLHMQPEEIEEQGQ